MPTRSCLVKESVTKESETLFVASFFVISKKKTKNWQTQLQTFKINNKTDTF